MNDVLREAQRITANLASATENADKRSSYLAGYDAAKNGANTTNCHFKHFGAPALTAAWERGHADAKAGLPVTPQ